MYTWTVSNWINMKQNKAIWLFFYTDMPFEFCLTLIFLRTQSVLHTVTFICHMKRLISLVAAWNLWSRDRIGIFGLFCFFIFSVAINKHQGQVDWHRGETSASPLEYCFSFFHLKSFVKKRNWSLSNNCDIMIGRWINKRAVYEHSFS